MGTKDGLLFNLSGSQYSAEIAEGNYKPLFCEGIDKLSEPASGGFLRVGRENSRYSFCAPGNIYTQRGTLCFFWRSVYPLGPTEFPIFRVSYADHTSWDTGWMRIDYNGWGFDAFITDCNLSRIRVSYALQPMPKPDEWTHLAISWDETKGICFYVNGVLVRERKQSAVLDAALDSFGPGGRLISYWGSQNRYNFIREGDMQDFRIYDHMLADDEIKALAARQSFQPAAPALAKEVLDNAFYHRRGLNTENIPVIRNGCIGVKKLLITDPFDYKRWSWKVCDGIAETTWPGVYNRSQLDGRTDYSVLPDWDCYSLSGKRLDFTLPPNTNYLEITGGAWGDFIKNEKILFRRERGYERSCHNIAEALSGQKISFINEMKEQPLSGISAFMLDSGTDIPEPTHSYALSACKQPPEADELCEFIRCRWPERERTALFAVPANEKTKSIAKDCKFVHIVLPFNNMNNIGLDGMILELPAVQASLGKNIPLQIWVGDPIWRYRSMTEITLAIEPNTPTRIWLDLRDRVLRESGCFHITFASTSPLLAALSQAKLHIVTKPLAQARAEHIQDRFLQIRDHFSNMIEERPKTKEFNAFNRFYEDITDLLRIDPNHQQAKEYYYLHLGGERPQITMPKCPDGVPEWAFWQTQYLHHFKHVVNWWIYNRQIENGEFGGGLSDDGDLTAIWPSLYLLGSDPDKIKDSLERQMNAFYDQDMFSSGLCKIQTDQLHTLEDGVQVIGQCLTVAPHDPQHLERAMETSRAMWRITGINCAGHRHFYSAYYSGHKIALERPWNFQNSDTLNILHPSYMLLRYNGNKQLASLIIELADSLLEHARNGRVHSSIIFDTDEDEYIDTGASGHSCQEDFLFKAAYEITGDKKYIQYVNDRILWNIHAKKAENPDELAAYYKQTLEDMLLLEYINTDGQVWSDRVQLVYDKIQQDRLGGIGHIRFDFYPRHFIEWRFDAANDDEKLGIYVTHADATKISMYVYNMSTESVGAHITGAEILPGKWQLTSYANGGEPEIYEFLFGREEAFSFTFTPNVQTVLELELLEKALPYHERTDLGIGSADIGIDDNGVTVTVHSLGAIAAPAVPIVLLDDKGTELARTNIPAMNAPDWLYPVTCTVRLESCNIKTGCSIVIDPENTLCEISKRNNIITL